MTDELTLKRQDRERDDRALKQLADHKAGRRAMPRLARVAVDHVDVAALREKLDLTQAQFAQVFGFSPRTVQNWEQGRRLPDRSAQILLGLIEAHPETVAEQVLRLAPKADAAAAAQTRAIVERLRDQSGEQRCAAG